MEGRGRERERQGEGEREEEMYSWYKKYTFYIGGLFQFLKGNNGGPWKGGSGPRAIYHARRAGIFKDNEPSARAIHQL